MRRRIGSLILLVAAIAGCRHKDASDQLAKLGDQLASSTRGPDPILLRLPREAGTARAYIYPKLDSVVWSGQSISVGRVLAFDPEGGTLAVLTESGQPGRIDLRFQQAAVVSKAKLTSLASVNGADIYGVDAKGEVVRLARSGEWDFMPPEAARAVFPQSDGSILVVAQQGGNAVAWKVRPPETKLADTVTLSISLKGTRTQVGDRVYFGTDTGLVGIQARTMAVVTPIAFKDQVTALAPTPSGDRIYVTTAGEHGLSVIDRYTDRVSDKIDLPGEVSAIRMDPLGRYVIAKPVSGDSAWIVAIATNRVVGSVHTVWTADLPVCAPDGAIALNNGRDVVFVDGETLQSVRTVVDGAKDYWYFMFWNGFRARAPGLDQPVTFAQRESAGVDTSARDTSAAERDTAKHAVAATQPVTPPASTAPVQPGSDSAQPHPRPPVPTPVPNLPVQSMKPAAAQGYTVSFAALLEEGKATELANTIIVNGVKARVVKSQRAGTPIYRVVLGPYPTHATADQVGRDSKRQYWIYAGEP